jgi:DNA-directed RNA polymerase subunit RPC12/RpoP
MAKPNKCAKCGAEILSVVYFDADGAPLGGHQLCTNCGPRSVVDVDVTSPDLHDKLLQRKAS